ncbi:MAG: MFS transporter [Candidatus Abyssubacteria bacterium]
MTEAHGRKVFYGWWIVAASFIVVFFGTGIGFYSFGVFVKPLEAEFGWTRERISVGVALWALIYGFSGPVIGNFLQKYGARAVMTLAALVSGAGYIIFSWLQSYPQFFFFMAVAGVSVSGITLIPNQTLISNWFDRYRGRAMGIMMVGIGLGGLAMPPLANAFILEYGWRNAFRLLGLLFFIIVPVVLLVVRTRPSDLGLQIDGLGPDARGAEEPAHRNHQGLAGLTVKRAFRTYSFWLLFVAFVLLIFGESGLTVHIIAFLDDEGVSSQAAAFYWGLAVGISCVGRLFFGFLAERRNPRTLITITHGLHAVALLIIIVFFLQSGIRSAAVLIPFSVVYGLALGGSAVLFPVLIARCFGLLNFSRLLGLLMSGFALGVVGGPLMAGRINDTTGSYKLALIIFVVAFALAAVAVSFIKTDRYRSEFIHP